MEIKKDKLYLSVKDHSVTGEKFELYHDAKLDLLSTFPKPEPSALAKYYESEDYISHTDSKRTLFEKVYHLVKGFALRNKVKIINSLVPKKGRLLDIGAGTGDFLVKARENGWICEGVEPSGKARSVAELKKLHLFSDTAKFESGSFDIITMWHVLEHVPDLDFQINELKRLLKPDGKILIAVPNFKSYDAQHYQSYWAAYDVPRHLWHFSEASIERMFGMVGLKLQQTKPMFFDAFYVSLLSEKYKTGAMNPLKAFIVGIKSNIKARKTSNYSSQIYILCNENK